MKRINWERSLEKTKEKDRRVAEVCKYFTIVHAAAGRCSLATHTRNKRIIGDIVYKKRKG